MSCSTFINALLSAEADAVCGAEYRVTSQERINRRNGYRHRDFDTPAGTLDVDDPPAAPPWGGNPSDAKRP